MSFSTSHSDTCLLLGGFILAYGSCSKDAQPIPEQDKTLLPPNPTSVIKGFYLLNEGNMNMNKASLDYLDYTTGIYRRDI